MGTHRSRLPLALAGAVLAVGLATVLLRPHDGLIEPAAVDPTAYFSAAQLDRANDYRGLQRILGLTSTVLGIATVALLALRPPAIARRALGRVAARPLLGAAAVTAGIAVALALVDLPLSIWRHERAVDAGLSTQSIGPWLGDYAKSVGISAVYAAIAGLLGMAVIRRFPRHWWAPGAAVVVAAAAAVLYLQPILVAPLFNDFEPLPRGDLRAEAMRLAERAGVDVGEVYRVDASRRTTAINAYVGGLGHTKRVVLYDNLIDDYPRAQVRSVVAHELGHVRHDDVPHALLWIAIVAPGATFLLQRLAERLSGGALGGPGRPGPRAMPAVYLAFVLVALAVGIAGNYVSRAVEARADAYALELTRDPDAFVELSRSLALRNLGDPDPPWLTHFLFGTHPTTVERIGFGVAYGRGGRP